MSCEICLAVRVGRSSPSAAIRPWKNAAAPAAMSTPATIRHAQCSAMPKLAMPNTAASISSRMAISPSTPATTIHALARNREKSFSVISVLASCNSFCSRSARSANRSVRACTSPESRSRSCAMELSRSALETVIHRVETVIHRVETVVHRVVLHGAFWWAALEHTEGKKTGQRGEAEHERGLLAGEIRRLLDEVLDGLVAQTLRELFGALGGVAHETGKLRRVLVEALGGGAGRVRYVIDHVGPGRDLHVEQTLRLFGGVGHKRRRRLLRLIAGLARSVGNFGRRIPGFSAQILRGGWGIRGGRE